MKTGILYLRLMRWQNLLMIALLFALVRYTVVQPLQMWTALSDWQYALLTLATLFIAGGGYIINDINDQLTDSINRPNRLIVNQFISEKSAYNAYLMLTLSGIGLGVYLATVINQLNFSGVFVLSALMLYLYATQFKPGLLVGNLMISFLVGSLVIIISMFDIFPTLYDGNKTEAGSLFKVFLDFALFSFLLNLLREWVKDLEDVKGDYNQGMQTLPIVLGVERSKKICLAYTLILMGIIAFYVNKYLLPFGLYWAAGYLLLFVFSGLGIVLFFLYKAKQPEHFRLVSTMLKVVMVAGMLALTVMTYNMIQNA